MPINVREGTLGAVLYNSKIISEDDITAALDEQHRSGVRFGEALVRLGIVTQEDIDWALSNQLEIPYIRLKHEMIDPDAISLLPAQLCRTHHLIPLIKAGNELSVAIADPLNKEAVAAAEQACGCNINLSVALFREISDMIDLCYGLPTDERLGFSSDLFSPEQLQAINTDCSGQNLLDHLLVYSLQNQLVSCSFMPMEHEVQVAGRSGLKTIQLGTLDCSHYQGVSSLIRTAAALPVSSEQTTSGTISFRHHNRDINFQVLIMRGTSGDYLTIKRLVSTQIPHSLAELQLSPHQKQQFTNLGRLHQGLVVFGSRSLQERCRFMDLMLEELDTSSRSVLVLGNEPGRMNKSFPRIPLPAADSDRGHLIMDALEHTVDVLVIEDCTLLEAFTAASRAAMRGKLVLAGMHIRGTANLCDHLIRYRRMNAFLTPFLGGLVSLKGIQLLCPLCRTPYELPQQELFSLHLQPPPASFFTASGCSQCGFTGISERIFLTDIICFDRELQDRFEEASDGQAFLALLAGRGYQGISVEGEALIRAGAVSPEEYIAAVVQ